MAWPGLAYSYSLVVEPNYNVNKLLCYGGSNKIPDPEYYEMKLIGFIIIIIIIMFIHLILLAAIMLIHGLLRRYAIYKNRSPHCIVNYRKRRKIINVC